jgi:sugar (pentulose or hexulose) kinase
MVCKPGATVADRVRALVENVGNLIVRMIEEFSDKEALSATSEIFVSGGGADLDFLLQYISDVSGRTLHRLSMREATAIGVARAAQAGIEGGFGANARQSEDVSASYRPTASARRRRYLMWQKLEHDLLHKTLPLQAEIEG